MVNIEKYWGFGAMYGVSEISSNIDTARHGSAFSYPHAMSSDTQYFISSVAPFLEYLVFSHYTNINVVCTLLLKLESGA